MYVFIYIDSVVPFMLADGKRNLFEAYQVICMVFHCEKLWKQIVFKIEKDHHGPNTKICHSSRMQ